MATAFAHRVLARVNPAMAKVARVFLPHTLAPLVGRRIECYWEGQRSGEVVKIPQSDTLSVQFHESIGRRRVRIEKVIGVYLEAHKRVPLAEYLNALDQTQGPTATEDSPVSETETTTTTEPEIETMATKKTATKKTKTPREPKPKAERKSRAPKEPKAPRAKKEPKPKKEPKDKSTTPTAIVVRLAKSHHATREDAGWFTKVCAAAVEQGVKIATARGALVRFIQQNPVKK